jgi:hypothetical protein
MTWLEATCYFLMACATGTAVAVARREEEGHAPIAIFLAGGGLTSMLASLVSTGIPPGGPSDPAFTGSARVLFHLDEALFLLNPIGLAATSVYVFMRRRPYAALPVWLAALAYLILTYPTTVWEQLRQVYLLIQLAALFVCVVSVASWLRRREAPQLAHVALFLIIGIELVALLFGAWGRGLFTRYDLAQWAYCVLFLFLIVMQGGALCLPKKRS